MKSLSIVFFVVILLCASAGAQTTTFSYQGSLKDGATAANGNYDFQFALFDAVSGGTQLGSTLTRNSVVVSNGIFSASLDFGSQFPGANRFLEIRVRLTGQPSLTTLAPRQPVNSAPYSVKSLSADTVGGVAPSGFIQNGTTLQTANQNISGNAFVGGVVAIGTTTPISGFKMNVEGGGASAGIISRSTDSLGVYGVSQSNSGVSGFSGSGNGVTGTGNTSTGIGVFGNNSSGGFGVFGTSFGGVGIKGVSDNYTGVIGVSTSGVGVEGYSTSNFGVYGSSNTESGVRGFSSGGSGIYGVSNAVGPTVAAVRGVNQVSGGNGVIGEAGGGNGTGVYGVSTSATGYGVVGRDLNGIGVYGESSIGTGVYGTSNIGSLTTAGVFGTNTASGGIAVIGQANSGPATGVFGVSTSSTGFGMYARNSSGGTALFADGPVVLATLGAAGGTSLCRNASNQIANCSSSLRYKKNIESFDHGLSLINKLKPITFDWKSNGMHDLGFGAEDVEKAEPLLVTYNDKGQVEGVKYDRISVVLVNAVKEQQAQIEAQAKQIAEQTEIAAKQQAVIEQLEKRLKELEKKENR